MNSNIVIGIVSWLPDSNPDRSERESRLNRLFMQLNERWPDIPIMIIAQNWANYKPIDINNKLIIKHHAHGLGILKARKELRKEFLESEFDYIILFDDDAIIEDVEDNANTKFINNIIEHPNGFSFLQYEASQLSGCAISRNIFMKEDIPDIDPQKDQGFEDTIFSTLLHVKYKDSEFENRPIKCIHFNNVNETAPSTWFNSNTKINTLIDNTHKIIDFISTNGDLPNFDIFLNHGELVSKEITIEEFEYNKRVRKIRNISSRIKNDVARAKYTRVICRALGVDVSDI